MYSEYYSMGFTYLDVEDMVAILGLKVFNFDNSDSYCSKNTMENDQISKL